MTEQRFVTVPGAQLPYVTVGDGPPTIVLAGGPGFGYTYLVDPLVARLSGDLQLTFYEYRIAGDYPIPEPDPLMTMSRFVEDVEAVRAATGATRVSLVGHSFGGLLALHYAMRYPEQVDRIVVLEGDPVRQVDWAEFRSVLARRRASGEQARMDSIATEPEWQQRPALVEEYFKLFLQPYFGRPEMAGELSFGFDRDSYARLAATSGAIRADLGDWDISADLDDVTQPVLLIYGDSSIFPVAAARSLATRLPRGELVLLPGVGHFPFVESPDRVASLVRGFLG